MRIAAVSAAYAPRREERQSPSPARLATVRPPMPIQTSTPQILALIGRGMLVDVVC